MQSECFLALSFAADKEELTILGLLNQIPGSLKANSCSFDTRDVRVWR